MIVINPEWGELFDKNEQTGQISKVLRCFHTDNSVTFDRFCYADNGEYRKPIEQELKNGACYYYTEDGNRPLKIKDCNICNQDVCNHNQKYY